MPPSLLMIMRDVMMQHRHTCDLSLRERRLCLISPSKVDVPAGASEAPKLKPEKGMWGKFWDALKSKVGIDLTAETMRNLSDDLEWVKLFSQPDIMEQAQKPLPKNAALTVKDVFLSLSTAQRKLVYLQYVDKFVDAGVQEQMVSESRVTKNYLAAAPNIHRSVVVPRGTIFVAGTVLPEGTKLPLETAGTREDEAKIDAGATVDPEFARHLPRGLVLPAGAVIPKGTYFPEAVVRGASPDAWHNQSDGERLQDLGEMLPVTTGVMQQMLGMESTTANPDQRKKEEGWARESLRKWYQTSGADDTFRRMEDFEAAMKSDRLKGFAPGTTDPALLEKELAPSRFKGALRLGVIDTNTLQKMLEQWGDHEKEVSRSKAEVAHKFDTETKASKRAMETEAKGMYDMWRGTSPGLKLAMVAAGIWLFRKEGFIGSAFRGAVLALGGGYLFQRFIMKDEHPGQTFSNFLNGPLNRFRRASNEAFGDKAPGYRPDASKRSEVIHEFLRPLDRKNLRTLAFGMMCLADVPMKTLAKNFHHTKDNEWCLDVSRGGLVDQSMSLAADKYEWSKEYKKYFQQKHNQEQVSDAVAYAFYSRAADEKSPPDLRSKVELVEKARGMMPTDSSYSRLRVYKFASAVELDIQGEQKALDADPPVLRPAELEKLKELRRTEGAPDAAAPVLRPDELAALKVERAREKVEKKAVWDKALEEAKQKDEIMQRAAKAYDELVTLGQKLFLDDDQDLGTYVQTALGLREKKEEVTATEETKADAKPDDVHAIPLAEAIDSARTAIAELHRRDPAGGDTKRNDLATAEGKVATAETGKDGKATAVAAKLAELEQAKRNNIPSVIPGSRGTVVEMLKAKNIDVAQKNLDVSQAEKSENLALIDEKKALLAQQSWKIVEDITQKRIEEIKRLPSPISTVDRNELKTLEKRYTDAVDWGKRAALEVAEKQNILAIESKKVEVAKKQQALAVAERAKLEALQKKEAADDLARKTAQDLVKAEADVQRLEEAVRTAPPATVAAARATLTAAKQKKTDAEGKKNAAEAAARTVDTTILAPANAVLTTATKAAKIAEAEKNVTEATVGRKRADAAVRTLTEQVDNLLKNETALKTAQSAMDPATATKRQLEDAQRDVDAATARRTKAEGELATAKLELAKKQKALDDATAAEVEAKR